MSDLQERVALANVQHLVNQELLPRSRELQPILNESIGTSVKCTYHSWEFAYHFHTELIASVSSTLLLLSMQHVSIQT